MFRTSLPAALCAFLLGVPVLVSPGYAQGLAPRNTVSEVPLPGGLSGALAATGDEIAPDRASFLLEFIRRTYDTPFGPRQDGREATLNALLAQLNAAGETQGPRETLPLPLSPKIWIDAVFNGRATADTLISSILQSRNASLLYYGLLSLDDETRWWLAGQPGLIGELSTTPAPFLAAAPGLRVSGARLHLPGGENAQPLWEALAGRSAQPAADFLRALMGADEGRLAYFYGALSQLTPAQISVALNLHSPDQGTRLESGRRLFGVFRQVSRTRGPRAFTRPALDPALLIADLASVRDGEPVVPGTHALWTAVFKEAEEGSGKALAGRFGVAAHGDAPADFPWLCERIFEGEEPEIRERRYMMALFASRRLGQLTAATAADAVDAIRAVGAFPALTAAIERAGVTDLAAFAAAARRAAALAKIDEDGPASRSLSQFQGALALITRAGARAAVAPAEMSALVSSLSAIETGESHDYEGRVVTWLRTVVEREQASSGESHEGAPPAGSAEEVLGRVEGEVERQVLWFLSGPSAKDLPVVEWEGTSYRVDLRRAELIRLTTALGDSARPWLSSAEAAVRLADAVSGNRLTPAALREQAEALAGQLQAPSAYSERGARDPKSRCHELTSTLRSAGSAGNVRGAARLASSLRVLADDLLAHGLMELAYAAALGRREGVFISAGEAAGRHDFGLKSAVRRSAAWLRPRAGSDGRERWGVRGSVLGLDVSLSDFSLVRLSSRPPARRPTLGDADRRAFIDAVSLVQPAFLTEADRRTILQAIRNGRARLASASTADDVREIAGASGLSGSRRTLLAWVVAHDRDRLGAFLSPRELLWLGLGDDRVDTLDAWGVPGSSRLGCLCAQVVGRRPWESFAGRESRGIGASAFPDLNLRLAELLTELHMPAALLAPVLSGATSDFIESVITRDLDDRRGLVEFVQGLRLERVEQYLALLTTDGPLVAVEDSSAQIGGRVSSDVPRGGVR